MITFDRHGPWAVVAGGSEGIGAAFAGELGKAGLNLVLIARKEGPLNDTAREIRAQSGVEVRTLVLDLTTPDMLDQIRKVTDGIDVGLLVYNAGADSAVKPFIDRPLEDALKLIRLNSVGQVSLSHHFGKKMVERAKGGIIIVGAMAAFAGAPTHVTYGALKSFGQTFAEGLWWEFKQHGVNVLYVAAGATATPAMTRLGLNDDPNRYQTATDLATGAVANIDRGPLYVPPHLQKLFTQFSILERPEATQRMAAFLYSYTKAEALAAGGIE
jgi:short-subunit dehydrogenase